jgi:hypothetical protein
VLKDVANDIGMHESTVSRATAGKYVHTPQGTFELKYFFTSSLRGGHGSEVSAESVKEKIREIIGKEDAQEAAERSVHRRAARQGADRHRPANGGKVPRADGHPALLEAQASVLSSPPPMPSAPPPTDRPRARGTMRIAVTFPPRPPTPALRAYAEEKLERVEKYLRRPPTRT